VTLTPIPGYNVASLSAEPRPLISSAKIPTYPSAAREKGIEGVVRLQLHAGNRVTVVDGPEELSNAAVDNVRTWDVGVPDADRPLDIRFTYSLQAGDCAPDQNPTVTMRLPYEVKIAAKRFTKCGG
jgi:outer membrane biosynthesis protein TonB